MKVLVTGSNGFIGKNLVLRLREQGLDVLTYTRSNSVEELHSLISESNVIIHLAGENRPSSTEAFDLVNVGLTQKICDCLRLSKKTVPFIIASSIQAELNNAYGISKYAAEAVVSELCEDNGNPVAIYRLPGVFGKWCKPNYNSVVATFCFNKVHNLPVQINDASTSIRVVYVDEVVNSLLTLLSKSWEGVIWPLIEPEYSVKLGELSAQIDAFKNSRNTLVTENVGDGFTRALYATYVSYLPKDMFAYDVPAYGDERGVFVEMLKTHNAGQFSFFTANPGVTRGGHYHHTKTEKFLVIKGDARFGFRHILTDEIFHIDVSGGMQKIIETVPGWTHDIKNIGDSELIVMLWANEIFNRDLPDTFNCKVDLM